MKPEPKHCDDYIDDPSSPEVLRKFLEFARSPGHGLSMPRPHPKLFATFNSDAWFEAVDPDGSVRVARGDRVRVTMASRLGDIGITKDLELEHGYVARCSVEDLVDFSDEP